MSRAKQKIRAKTARHLDFLQVSAYLLVKIKKEKELNRNTIVPSALDEQVFDCGSGECRYVFLCRKPFDDHG
jgi:hypothetical protein